MKKIALFTKEIVIFIAVFSFIFALFFSSLDIFTRILFNKFFLWVTPVTQYLFVTSGLFAFLLTIENNEMLQISLLKKVQKYKIIHLLLKLCCILTAVTFVIVFTRYNLKIYSEKSFSVEEIFYKLPYLIWAFFMLIFFVVYPVFNQKIDQETGG